MTIRGFISGGQNITKTTQGLSMLGLNRSGIESAVRNTRFKRRLSRWFFGDDVNDPSHRIGPVKMGGGALDNFYSFNMVKGNFA